MDACKFDENRLRRIVREELRFLIIELSGIATRRGIEKLADLAPDLDDELILNLGRQKRGETNEKRA